MLDLLRLELDARPSSATEVMERLSAIDAETPGQQLQAYLDGQREHQDATASDTGDDAPNVAVTDWQAADGHEFRPVNGATSLMQLAD